MFAIDQFKFKVVKEKKDYGSYEIGPLPKGYGVTFGNALRRILLSNIEGAAVTSVKIEGVKHEYATLPGVIDDVLNILLKVKRLAIISHSDEPQTLELDVKGKKEVFAKDFTLTSDVEIANPDFKITELTDAKAKLQMTMEVEKNIGYAPSDESKRRQVGVIPLDANFSPVKRVVVNVSKTRVGQQIDLDQIDLEIYTNGAVKPKDAMDQAVSIFRSFISHLSEVITGETLEEVEESMETEKQESEEKAAASSELDIDKLNLSARLTNSLLKAGYKNLTDLEGMSVDEIMEIRGLGQRSVEELIESMKSYKLEVKE